MAKRIVLGDDDRVGRWGMQRVGGDWHEGQSFAIGLEQGGELIAAVMYDGYNRKSICMHVAAEPGRLWLTRDFLGVAFAYPFRQLGVFKVLGLVGSDNLRAQALDEHLGFVLEATLIDAHPGGDLLIYSMTKDQCPWLQIKVPQNVIRQKQHTLSS